MGTNQTGRGDAGSVGGVVKIYDNKERACIIEKLVGWGYTRKTAEIYTRDTNKHILEKILLAGAPGPTRSIKESSTRTCRVCGFIGPATQEYFKDYKKAEGDTLTFTCRKCYNKRHNKYTHDRWEKYSKIHREARLKREYNISLEDYNRMLKEQDGVCYICKKPEIRKHKDGTVHSLSVDHNHKTGALRKLVCGRCNYIIGLIERKMDIVFAVIQYIENHRHTEIAT